MERNNTSADIYELGNNSWYEKEILSLLNSSVDLEKRSKELIHEYESLLKEFRSSN